MFAHYKILKARLYNWMIVEMRCDDGVADIPLEHYISVGPIRPTATNFHF